MEIHRAIKELLVIVEALAGPSTLCRLEQRAGGGTGASHFKLVTFTSAKVGITHPALTVNANEHYVCYLSGIELTPQTAKWCSSQDPGNEALVKPKIRLKIRKLCSILVLTSREHPPVLR